MDKTIKISLAGSLFQLDEDAYLLLKDYLREISNRFRNVEGGTETIEDIESRIAELFQSQKGLAGVITQENVVSVISIIGKPEDFDIEGDEKESPKFSPRSRSLYRNPDDTIISGVCGGIGTYMNIEAVWIRILFILFAFFFGVGFFVYLALWIALPSARSENQKRELSGSSYSPGKNSARHSHDTPGYSAISASPGTGTSGAGSAINEIFKALGRVFFIVVRILLIIMGTVFVMTGFLTILSFVMIFFFKYPGHFSTNDFGVNLFYLPDFLDYIVNPALSHWIIALTFIVIALPMIAFIYWGLKMIFLFRAKDGIISIIALMIWVMCAAALSIILFNEGISFAETGRTTSVEVLTHRPGEICIMAKKKVDDLQFDKEIALPDEKYQIFLSDQSKDIFIRTYLTVHKSDDDLPRIEVRKRSSGRNKTDAKRKTEELIYNYTYRGDTLWLDEFFTIPEDKRWSCDHLEITLQIPEGTRLKVDRSARDIFSMYNESDFDPDNEFRINSNHDSWIMTADGLRKSQ